MECQSPAYIVRRAFQFVKSHLLGFSKSFQKPFHFPSESFAGRGIVNSLKRGDVPSPRYLLSVVIQFCGHPHSGWHNNRKKGS